MFGFKRLARDEDGVTVIEFAFVAPVMVLLLTGILEFGYVLFARSTLESAVLEGARSSRVLDCPNENAKAVEEFIQNRMDVVASANGQKAKLVVDSYGQSFGDVGNPEPYDDVDGNGTRDVGESYTDVNGNGEWDSDMGTEGDFGSFGEVVRFTASYEVASILPFLAQRYNGKPSYSIEAATVVRNEPFKDATCAI